jgi:hypothetical protein
MVQPDGDFTPRRARWELPDRDFFHDAAMVSAIVKGCDKQRTRFARDRR